QIRRNEKQTPALVLPYMDLLVWANSIQRGVIDAEDHVAERNRTERNGTRAAGKHAPDATTAELHRTAAHAHAPSAQQRDRAQCQPYGRVWGRPQIAQCTGYGLQGAAMPRTLHEMSLYNSVIPGNSSMLVFRLLVGVAFVAATLQGAHAQMYPVKPIRLIVPNAPGGGTDTVARAISDKLAPALGQPIIVDNRGGAGGRIAAELVARAPKDGYTLLLGSAATLITGPALDRDRKYDPVKDFASISLAGTTAYMLAV